MKMKFCVKYLLILSSVLLLFVPIVFAQGPNLNQKPCLRDGTIDPQSGTTRKSFVAQVRYYDPDGKKPIKVQVVVDDVSYALKRASGKPNNGMYKCKLALPPGEHAYYFYAEDNFGDAVRFPRYGQIKGPLAGIARPIIVPAKLINGGLIKQTGTDKSLYTYTVNYNDPQSRPPLKINIVIDGITYPMHLHKGKQFNGTYITIINLPAGPHAYYFKAMDALGNCITLPEQGFIRGPEVSHSYNSAPRLFDVKLQPIIGYKSTSFTYNVTYLDEDFDPPSIIHIVIDGVTHPLKLKAGTKYNGIYFYRAKQYLGNYHNYYFYCEDGKGGIYRIPETGTFHGPVVVK